MAALNLAGKTSGYIKLKSPDVALNATVELPNKDGILATLDDIGTGGGGSGGGSVETVNAPAFSVHIGNTPQSIPSTSWVQVNLDDVKFDSHNAFNTSNSRFTPTVAGYYQVTAYAYFIDAQNASMVRIEKNGTEIKRGTRAGSNGTAYSIASLVTALVYMNGTTDYLTMGAYHSDTQPRNINSNAYFEGVLVKPANSGTLVGGDPVTLDALGIPNHDKVTVDDTGILGGVSKVNVVKDGNDSAAYTAKTNLGHFGFGVGIETATNCFNIYDYNKSISRFNIDDMGNIGIGHNTPTKWAYTNAKTLVVGENRGGPQQGKMVIGQRGDLATGSTQGASIGVAFGENPIRSAHIDFGCMGDSGQSGRITFNTKPENDDSTAPTERMRIDADGRVDITGSLYVNNNPKSVDVQLSDMETRLADREKLIDKLSARLDKLEKRLK